MKIWRQEVRRLALIGTGEREAKVYDDPHSIPGFNPDKLDCRIWPFLLGSQDQLPRSRALQRLNGFAGPAPHPQREATYYGLASVFNFDHGAPNDDVPNGQSRGDIAEVAFPQTPNDLVVPTASVYQPSQGLDASGRFPLQRERLMVLHPSANATHVGLLHLAKARERVLNWLGA